MMEGTERVIKRYANRKLYDTQESRYVTLDQIAEMIRNSEDVKVIDNNTKEDLTSVTLAQIIFEEEKRQRSFLPLAALRNIIQSGGESLQELTNLISESAGRMGRVFRPEPSAAPGEGSEEAAPADGGVTESGDRTAAESANMFKDFMDTVQGAIDDWQKRIEASVNNAMESVSPFAPLQKEIQILGERISELERAVGQLEDTPADSSRRPEP